MKKSKIALTLAAMLCAGSVYATDKHKVKCPVTHAMLSEALTASISGDTNGGFDLNMWGTVVNREGVVCAVAKTGEKTGDQWPGSRVISAQKANTANSFSLPGLAISTANLWAATQPGGSLFGLQHSNPVDTSVAYRGKAKKYGTKNDALVGKKIGGVNVFGGGLALYNSDGKLVGALGVSGDTSCADHNIAWRTRDILMLDFVPAGPGGLFGGTVGDNIIFDIQDDMMMADSAKVQSDSGFGHPKCGGPAGDPDDAIDNDMVISAHPLDEVVE